MSNLNNETTAPYTFEDALECAKELSVTSDFWKVIVICMHALESDGLKDAMQPSFDRRNISNDAEFIDFMTEDTSKEN